MKPVSASRRRFLSVIGASAACAGLPVGPAVAGRAPEPVVWKGTALGAVASMTLVHEDRAHALRVLGQCIDEIERLERILSL